MTGELSLACAMKCSWQMTSSRWNIHCMSANMANSAIHSLGVDKWVVSWTQAFTMRICVMAPPGKYLPVKAGMVLFAGNTVWSIWARQKCLRRRTIQIDVTFTFTLTLGYWNLSYALASLKRFADQTSLSSSGCRRYAQSSTKWTKFGGKRILYQPFRCGQWYAQWLLVGSCITLHLNQSRLLVSFAHKTNETISTTLAVWIQHNCKC